MSRVFLGLGSNLGNRKKNIQGAVKLIEKNNRVIKVSSFYETEPEGVKEQPIFLNAVLELETKLSPHQLLNFIQDIEKQLGRKPTVKWGARIIDLDILLYGEQIINDDDLKIPHPHFSKRLFVLIPLGEIAPEIIHPVLKRKIADLLRENSDKKH